MFVCVCLYQAATAAIVYLNNVWDKYIDDKLHIITSLILFGKKASYDASMINENQEWLFAWSLIYFKGVGITFPISQ